MSLDHISELPEVRRYFDDGKHNFMLHGGFGIRYIRESIADAALTAADREVGRLKMCGSCDHHQYGRYECELWRGGDKDPSEDCHFEPSRWVKRGAS